jgi:serine/threonine protein kinase
MKAPELFNYSYYDAKIDIWSTGCIFYEMLYGVSPFHRAHDKLQLAMMQQQKIFIPPHIVVSDFTTEILFKVCPHSIFLIYYLYLAVAAYCFATNTKKLYKNPS